MGDTLSVRSVCVRIELSFWRQLNGRSETHSLARQGWAGTFPVEGRVCVALTGSACASLDVLQKKIRWWLSGIGIDTPQDKIQKREKTRNMLAALFLGVQSGVKENL